MLESNVYYDIASFISGNVFYDPRHAVIFGAVKSLAEDGRPVDLFTVSNKLKEDGKLKAAGGTSYVAQITQAVASGAHTKYHAQVLYEMWIMRSMASELSQLCTKCYSSPFDTLVSEYQTSLAKLDSLFAGSGGDKHISSILRRHGELVDQRCAKANSNEIQGITYGLRRLDKITGGMQPGQLIIVAARPAMGKTAIALKFAKAPAEAGAAVTFASLEMTDLSLTDRLISSYAGVEGSRLRSGHMNRDDIMAYERASRELSRLNISIDDTAGATLSRLSAMARTKHRKGDLDLLIIDYLQLIDSDGDNRDFRRNREQEVAIISRGLKKLAKDLGIPVVLLCQLNRAVENRADKRPQLHDLRESGGIEQDADIVMMPFRPAYYKEQLAFTDDNGLPIPDNVGLLCLRKQRDGELGEIPFQYSTDLSKITDYDPANQDDTDHGLF